MHIEKINLNHPKEVTRIISFEPTSEKPTSKSFQEPTVKSVLDHSSFFETPQVGISGIFVLLQMQIIC